MMRDERPQAAATLLVNERRIGALTRWLLLILGTVAIWTAPGRPLAARELPWGLILYGIWVIITTLFFFSSPAHPPGGRWSFALAYASDVIFVSYLIGPSGGLASPFYMLYGLLALRAALYISWHWGAFLLPFILGPLYIVALAAHTGDLSFLLDRQFLMRYALLFLWTLTASATVWLLGERGSQVERLREQLGEQAITLEQNTTGLTRTATDLGERVLELRALQEVARALASALGLEETLQVIVNRLAELSQAQYCGVALTDNESNTLLGTIVAGPDSATFQQFRFSLQHGSETDHSLAQSLLDGRAVLLQLQDTPQDSVIHQLVAIWGGHPCLIMPLLVRSRLIGALFLVSQEPDWPNEQIRQLTANFAFFSATAIENARLYQTIWDKGQELEAVLGGIGDGVVVADRDLHLVMMNPVATGIFGLEATPPSGVPLARILSSVPLLELLQETLDSQSNVIHDLGLDDGNAGDTILTYQALGSPLLDESSQLRGVVVVLRDITVQKELERMKSNFLSVISHELRTPLHSIKGFVDIIMMGKTGPVTELQEDFLTTVQEQTGHLQRLIDDLLEFSRMESGQIRLRIGSVALPQIAAQVVSKLTPLAESAGLHLEVQVPPDLPMLEGDGMRIEQVLTNLVENGVKFTPEGGSVIVRGEDMGDEVQISVHDTGIGIPPAQLEKIFDRFYQVDSGSNRLYRGTGLGLTICRHIIAHHGGRIWAESDDHSGSTFYFVLPKTLAAMDASMDFTTLPERA